ncbi:MAG: dihydrofolate reductase family protein [Nakamurella sp.]
MTRQLVYLIATTLDGFIAGADRSNPDFFGFDGPEVPDLIAEFPDMFPAPARPLLGLGSDRQRFDTVLMGRATYDVGRPVGLLSPYPHLRQILVSTTVADPPDPAVEVLSGAVQEAVRELKNEPGKDIWLAGGGRLAAALADQIDEIILKVHPVVLGAGAPLFDGPIGPRKLSMTEQRLYPNGFALQRGRWSET